MTQEEPMAIPKICGLEQEYAIVVKNAATFDPIHASYLVVNSFDRAADTVWMGVHLKPGASVGTTRIVIPRCLGASGSVRAATQM